MKEEISRFALLPLHRYAICLPPLETMWFLRKSNKVWITAGFSLVFSSVAVTFLTLTIQYHLDYITKKLYRNDTGKSFQKLRFPYKSLLTTSILNDSEKNYVNFNLHRSVPDGKLTLR